MKENNRIIISSIFLFLMTSCLAYSLYRTFIQKLPTSKKEIKKQPFQTYTYYLAEKNGVDIALKESDLTSKKLKMVLFNVTPLYFICIINNNKLISVDRNIFAKYYSEDETSCNSEFMQIIAKIFYLSGFLYFEPFIFNRIDDLVNFNDIRMEGFGEDCFRVITLLNKSIKS